MLYAEVYVNKKIAPLDHTFIYEIPPHLIGRVQVGTVVSAPFGHATVRALVIALRQEPGSYETKYIDDIVNEDFLFPRDLLELGIFIADYYMNTTMSVFRAMLPSGIDIFGKIQKPKTETWLKVGQIVEPASIKGAKQRELYEYLLAVGEAPQNLAARELAFSASVPKALIDKGLVTKEARPVARYSYQGAANGKLSEFTLTPEQRKVLTAVLNREKGDKRPLLLHGVTGSGKTEIYLRLAAEMYKNGKQTIVLMPEIALTPQFVSVFEERFPGEVVLMHSRLSSGERRDAWYAANEGKAKIVLGPRSAVFAPVENLGLIIMDEEHEESYEQDNTPRFHAREVAINRCELKNAIFLMGSATPSLETYKKALAGEYQLLTMAQRIEDRPLPTVEVVDMRQELAAGWKEVLSRSLLQEMEACLSRQSQVMLFLNRLGSKTFVSCRDCGFVYQCPDCGVSLIYYESRNILRCSRCGYQVAMAGHCPQCAGERIKYFGLGTEGLEKVVKKYFPQARIARLDSDVTRFKGEFDRIYSSMRQGKIDILIGTRMMAKGWDFPNVTLTGIIAADLTLNFPDFRAAERTFQSITQVSGRCGRGREAGKVVLQTYRPAEKAIQLGAAQDYQGFYTWEDSNRQNFAYPPYAELLKIVFTAPKGYFFEADTAKIKDTFLALSNPDFQIFGPVPAVYRYHKNEEKMVLTLMGRDLATLKNICQAGLEKLAAENKVDNNVKIQVQVNPLHII